MDKKTFLELIGRYLNGTAAPSERRLIEEYYQRLEAEDRTPLTAEQEQALKQLLLQNIRKGMRKPVLKLPSRHKRISYWVYGAAASLFIVLATGLFFWQNNAGEQTISAVKDQPLDIAPGGNEATLILADGSRILLDDAANGLLATQGITTITKANDGQLVYDLSSLAADSKPVRNTISTPYGGQYHVILPDGTKVWINAGSSLTFPTVFTGSERSVQLKGEAYFEVAHNQKMPFRVEAGEQVVEVLGTHFNVMAYPDETSVNTTLLEGSVRVIKGSKSRLIKPGQQSRVDNGDIEIIAADTQAVTAWKDGYFVFKNEDLNSIMRKISRWYNVDIKYEGYSGGKTFGGKIARSRNLSEVLKMLQLTGSVRFKIEETPSAGKERRVVVMP